ncbi:hypothetical protein OH76DRAFT_798849 [Lentinus brumalis]|uniref:SET domain-containing protein n=1 Tax=Lentinus brumalis TaxID=2498619 RepID=A0A371D3R2_9APHY|nr:hypothetical protein OH76DRAFT_798849 [Polyporus brumalis]
MHSFDTATLTHVLRAVHAIRAGEEVTISYLNDELGTCDARQKELCRRYLFKCKCKSCQLTGEARMVSDIARMTIAESAQTAHILQDEAAFRVWLAKGAMPGPSAHDANGLHPLETAEQLWRAMEQEGCYVPLLWELLLQRLVRGFATQENEQAVRHYARKAAELRMAHSGEDGGWLAVAENPRKTEGWAWRSERRKV